MASLYVVAMLFAVAVQGQLSRTTKAVLNSLVLSDDDHKDAYNGLDITRDGKIDREDLDYMVNHIKGEFVKTKIFRLVDTEPDTVITPMELKDFLNNKPVTYAVQECHYVRPQSLREYCFADQILTYVFLVLTDDVIEQVFSFINVGKRPEIWAFQVAKLATKTPKFKESQQENLEMELGGIDNKMTSIEFSNYLNQEELLGHFRPCRNKLVGSSHEYDPQCLLDELVDFTMTHVTDLDVATTFDQIDKNEKMYIEKDDLKVFKDLCDDATADNFIRLMDKSKEGTPGKNKVSFGEFRAYIMAHTVKMHLQRECVELLESKDDQITCYMTEIFRYAKENHTPIWLKVPDLDMLFLFEDLDASNNGQLSVQADLVDGKKWDQKVAQRLVDEIDRGNRVRNVNLEEFNEYVDQPNMVFGMGDCIGEKIETRVQCYEIKLKKMMTIMLDKRVVYGLFHYIDQDNNEYIEADDLKELGVVDEEAENFLKELGMGDMKVTPYEFLWFNRQQELSQMFKDDQCSDNATLFITLKKYLNTKMTEHDILQLFKALDKNNNYELETSDFNADNDKVEKLLQRMFLHNRDKTVNLVDFWLYLKSPKDNPKKRHLERKCTQTKTTQEEEIDCYKTEILEVGANKQ